MADYPNVLTIIAELILVGENEIYEFYLNPYKQYTFVAEENRYRSAEDIAGLDTGGINKTHVLHYKVVSDDGLDYCWIPAPYVALENYLRTPEQQDKRVYQEEVIVDQPRDHVAVYKDITGQDLAVYNKAVVHNGFEFYKKALRERHKNNGKVYGRTIPKV